jgi:hypothetical protein
MGEGREKDKTILLSTENTNTIDFSMWDVPLWPKKLYDYDSNLLFYLSFGSKQIGCNFFLCKDHVVVGSIKTKTGLIQSSII